MITQQLTDSTAEIATYLSLLIMLVAVIVYFILSWRLYGNWSKTGSDHSKWLCLFFITIPVAIIFLLLELGVLKILTPDGITSFKVFAGVVVEHTGTISLDTPTVETLVLIDFLGWLFATIAIFISSVSATIINMFALGFLDTKWRKIAVIPSVMAFMYWFLHSFGSLLFGTEYHHTWVQEYQKGTWDMSYTAIAELVHLPLLVLPLLFPSLTLFYVAWKVRVKGRPAFIRAFLIAFGLSILLAVYVFEVLETIPIMTAFVRLGFVYFPLHMYVCLLSPNWFKRLIGSPVD